MPIQIQDINEQDDSVDCPLCMETLEVDDINFFPCECGYQICRFCWHRIRTDENGLCPACRKSYPENPAEFKPLSEQELQKIRLEKKQKEVARRQKITDSRKHLANVRVLQKNLVFVVGLSQRLSDVEILKKQEYFGKYGKILKVVLNSNTSYAGTQAPSCSAYVTYSKVEESLRAIQSVNNVHIDGRTLKASLGTTKYCSNYLKNQVCQKHDCMYLHEIGDEDASFTKEDMQLAKHQEYEQKLIQQMIQKEISQAQQEMRNKTLRQETASENSGSSAGSSPPTATSALQQNLSVAQAVKKNAKGTPDNPSPTNRLRRHSSSTPTLAVGDATVDGEFQNKNSGKGPRLCTSVGDRDNKGISKNQPKRPAGKKSLNNQNPNQAPRHKKQQQLQQANANKKLPRAHSASPSAQITSTDSTGGNSPPSSMPLSTGPSTESSPVVTPLRDDTSELSKTLLSSKLKYALGNDSGSSSSKVALRFSEESPHVVGDPSGAYDRRTTLPIDIPATSEEDMNRDTPHSDSSSSIDRKSPFVRDMSQDGQFSINSSIPVDSNAEKLNHLSKSRFMMLHKENGSNAPSQIASNGLGFSPFGMASHQTGPSLIQALPVTETEFPLSQPIPRGMPPPGLSGIPSTNMSGWPTSNQHLSDSIPIKSTNDWEAAFGFKSATESKESVVSSADDDFGFDPWAECSKGLADLMEKEKTQESGGGDHRMMAADPFRANTFYNNANTMHRRPNTLQDQSQRRNHMVFSGGSELINGFSNLLAHNSQIPQQHKMPFQYDQQQQRHVEQNRFLQQQRLSSHFSRTDTSERSIQQLLEAANAQKQAFLNHGSPMTPSKDLPGNKNAGNNNIQEWQNGLRALLPSVNINFATQGQTQRPVSRPLDSSLGLSSLGMLNNPQKVSIPHPPGITNSNMGHMPFLNKQNIMPPPGVGFAGRSSFMPNRQQWGNQESSMSMPGLPSNRLMSPTNVQSMFPGNRAESNPLPSAMPSYPPDPAIIQGGGIPGFPPTQRRSRLFENPQSKSSIINSNINSNDEQPHWMKSLQALTEPDSPIHSMPPSNNPNLNQLFSQRPANSMSWPSMPGMFSNSGLGPSQPPPGFQVRPSLTKPTEFGMIQSLLENQS